MAKYEITHSCGHSETVNICGTNVHGERESRAEYLASMPCRECRNRAETERARVIADDAGMPRLAGTEKQVAWAERIRLDMVKRMRAHGYDAESWARGISSASEWIDMRDDVPKEIGLRYGIYTEREVLRRAADVMREAMADMGLEATPENVAEHRAEIDSASLAASQSIEGEMGRRLRELFEGRIVES